MVEINFGRTNNDIYFSNRPFLRSEFVFSSSYLAEMNSRIDIFMLKVVYAENFTMYSVISCMVIIKSKFPKHLKVHNTFDFNAEVHFWQRSVDSEMKRQKLMTQLGSEITVFFSSFTIIHCRNKATYCAVHYP